MNASSLDRRWVVLMIATFTGFFVAPGVWAGLSLIAFVVLSVIGAVALYRGKDAVFEDEDDEGGAEERVCPVMPEPFEWSTKGHPVWCDVDMVTGRMLGPGEKF